MEFFRLKASEALGEILKRRENNKTNKDTVSNYYFGR